jgi:hypothetical protein
MKLDGCITKPATEQVGHTTPPLGINAKTLVMPVDGSTEEACEQHDVVRLGP